MGWDRSIHLTIDDLVTHVANPAFATILSCPPHPRALYPTQLCRESCLPSPPDLLNVGGCEVGRDMAVDVEAVFQDY
jgi:hypothetical protein